jgi:hypothetical protein
MKATTIVGAGALVVGLLIGTEARAQERAPQASTTTEQENSPDHERFIRHFAVGYQGISQILVGQPSAGTPATTQSTTLTAPVVGVRYWLQRGIGIDAGVGLGYAGSSSSSTTNGVTTSTNGPSIFGFALHGGVPLAFAEGRHYTFELVPEATFGFAGGSQGNVGETGVRLDVGGRIGAEVHFGFIGVPELALQASVGLYFEYRNWGWSQGPASGSTNTVGFGTSVQDAPWAIFANTISALYYF